MSPAVASLIALLIAIALSLTSRVNVGVVSIIFAWLIGTLMAGLKPDQVAGGFPSPLFLTLVGVTFLFALAECNGTLERMTNRAVRLARGNARVVSLIFFGVACLISTIGPGAIISVALVAPLAMALAPRMGVSPFLTALMVANGANAGNLSPISATGVIANTKIAEAGIGGHEMKVWMANLVAHALVAGVAYVFLSRRLPARAVEGGAEVIAPAVVSLERAHQVTLAVIVLWIVGVV